MRGHLLLWARALRAAAPAPRRGSRSASFRPRGPCGCVRLVGLLLVALAVFLGARSSARVLLARFACPYEDEVFAAAANMSCKPLKLYPRPL